MSQQYLGGQQAVTRKVVFVALGQTVLPHCSGGLQLVHSDRARLPTQPHHAGGHGSR